MLVVTSLSRNFQPDKKCIMAHFFVFTSRVPLLLLPPLSFFIIMHFVACNYDSSPCTFSLYFTHTRCNYPSDRFSTLAKLFCSIASRMAHIKMTTKARLDSPQRKEIRATEMSILGREACAILWSFHWAAFLLPLLLLITSKWNENYLQLI